MLLLRKFEKFASLSDEDRQLVTAHTQRIQHFGPQEDLVRDSGGRPVVSLILEGWACRYRQLEDGRRQIVSFFVPGDLCDPAVLLLRRMSHTLGSLTDVTVARVTRDEMDRLSEQSPALARAFLFDMLLSAEIQREWTISLGRRTATERMAHLFCEIPMRLKAVGLSDGIECEMPLTQADLADALGLSAVHVNRTLQELRAAGLVELRHRRLVVRDEAALRDLAMFDPAYLHFPRNANA